MDKNKKYQILKYSLLFLLVVFSFFLWRSVDRAIFVQGASVWMAPIIWSSLFFFALSLAIILIKERTISLVVMALSFLMSFVYSFSVFHLLILILAILFVLAAEGRIREDFRERLKINLGKNIRAGSTFVILALSFVIASQYYFETKNLATEKYLPRFEMGKETSGLMLKAVSNFLPQAKDLADENLTVDQFLLNLYEKQNSASLIEAQLENLSSTERMLAENMIKEAENDAVLVEGRKKLSQIVLREVGGDEKISDVFSEIVNKKISGYFVPNLGSQEGSSIFSFIVALVILLSVYSLGVFLRMLWVPVIKLIFFILKKSGAISVVMVPAEKEIVE